MATRHRRNQEHDEPSLSHDFGHSPSPRPLVQRTRHLGYRLTFGAALACAALACGNAGDAGVGSGESGGSGSGGGLVGAGGAGAGTSAPPFSCQPGNGTGEMVGVAAGQFLMGCNQDVDNECRGEEFPARTIHVSDFQIDKTEVTQSMYAACVHAKACTPPLCEWNCDLGNHPAGCVTRQQAMDFCAFAGKRLPTEAEWEKAARGSDGRKFPWGNDPPNCDLANISGCGEMSKAAGSSPAGASPYGALDMAGNMVEMVSDWYDPGYYQVMPDQDPKGPASGATYSGRGGGFKSEARWNRTSQRDWYDPTDQGRSLGFRCAR